MAEGGTGTYTVKLDTEPGGSVTVAVSSGDAEVATASPAALTFTTGNWSAAQTVTVSGVDNDVDAANPAVSVSHAVTGYGSVTASGVAVTVTDDDTAGVTVSASDLTVAEGETGTYTVKLDTEPGGSVTVAVSSGDAEVATASPAALTFTTGNWSAAQTVTVSGVDNDVDAANPAVSVSHAVTGYGSVTASGVAVTVTDDDTAGVTVSASDLTVAEGETGTYTVKLDTEPGGSVTVAVSSGDAEVATASPAALTFTTGNWSAAQTVTVSGVDNDVDAANPAVSVSHAVTGYGSVTASGVAVTVTDDDTAGVTVSASDLTVAEGETGTYTVKLDTEPGGSVTVAVSSGDAEVATASPAALTFTTGNWSAAQTVTVSGVDNDVDAANGGVGEPCGDRLRFGDGVRRGGDGDGR